MDDLLRDFLTESGESLTIIDGEMVKLEAEGGSHFANESSESSVIVSTPSQIWMESAASSSNSAVGSAELSSATWICRVPRSI